MVQAVYASSSTLFPRGSEPQGSELGSPQQLIGSECIWGSQSHFLSKEEMLPVLSALWCPSEALTGPSSKVYTFSEGVFLLPGWSQTSFISSTWGGILYWRFFTNHVLPGLVRMETYNPKKGRISGLSPSL